MTDERALTSYWPRRSLSQGVSSLSSSFLALSLHIRHVIAIFLFRRVGNRRGDADSTRGGIAARRCSLTTRTRYCVASGRHFATFTSPYGHLLAGYGEIASRAANEIRESPFNDALGYALRSNQLPSNSYASTRTARVNSQR